MKRVIVLLAILVSVSARAADRLTILKAGPVGEVANLAEANEIRVVFSEPMVVVGKIPKDLSVPWFHVVPELRGTFRWSGTTTLIFTPDPRTPLPFATRYEVTIDAEAKSIAGKTLGKPYTFSFITPTILLLNTKDYRTPNGALVIGLRFNQPVEAQTIIEHLQLRTAAHVKDIPPIPSPERLAPADVQAFEARKAKSQQAFASEGATVLSFVADSWDVKKLGLPSPDMVVLQTKPGIVYGTHLKIFLDSKLASQPTKVATGREQQFTIQTPDPFFVEKISCAQKCDPDAAVYIDFIASVMPAALASALTVTDITDPAHPSVVQRRQTDAEYNYPNEQHHLDEFGYFLQPARKYEVRIAPTLESVDGQTLGYTWVAVIDNWHRQATTSFGDGHGVWESSAGTVLPFYAENFVSVNQWMQPLTVDQLVPTLVKLEKDTFADAPPVPPQKRTLRPVVDKMTSYGVDIAPVLHNGKGLAWLALQPGETIPQALLDSKPIKATVVQVTNLGISVKDSPQNTLVFVTRLDNGAPVAGANVSIRTLDNKVFWSGTTDAGGIAIAPRTDLRRAKAEKKAGDEPEYGDWKSISELRFVVIAEKEGDAAYAASNWNEGINPYEFEGMFNLAESEPMLRGTIFTDRGVYKPGEEVHAKVVLRSDTPNGIQLLPAGTKVSILTMNSRNEQADTRTIALNEWSSAEWTYTIPADALLGNWTTTATVDKQRLSAGGEFLVAAYRRPEFRVDVKLSGPSHVAGATLDGNITARYLFGAPMSKRPVRWLYTRTKLFSPPENIEERWADRFSFLGDDDNYRNAKETIASKEQKLDANGVWKQKLETTRDAGKPFEYELEGEVTDVSRQKIAGRMSYRIDPAPWYVGIRIPTYFADTAKGLDVEVITPALDAKLAAGVPVKLTLTQIQWNSVRRAEGNGFYTWDTEKKEVPAGEWTVTSAAQPAPLHIAVANGGQYKLTATASDGEGRTTSTRVWFYATGGGYTAWERFDHNRIELVPEKKTLKPGETARIMIKSPWEHATALVTTEREGVRSWKPFELTSTQQTISVPITEADIPNVFVSVLLIKGRSKEAVTEDASDPGKPAFRLGYTELTVVDAAKRLKVELKANRDEYRPAAKAKIDVTVRDPKGQGTRSEVTLWAVDYGVLSLTGYQTPNVIDDVYLRKALQVVNDDSRQKIISRRVLTAKGAAEGGGGGRDAGPGMIRKDFRVLAFWVGSLVTDGKGRAHTEVALPESLTTYRIMAVAADKASRFGAASSEIRINKPLLLTTTFPRFLAVGDKAFFGGVVHSQLKQRGTATVTIKSLDPNVLRIDGAASAQTPVDANGTAEVRFDATAVAIGTARVQMSVVMNGESDAFEDVIPVRILLSPETVAAYGAAGASPAKETLEIPSGVVPDFGGIHVDLSSTMMVGLGEGARYLVEYPYGCAEQRSSTGLALMLIADLGDAFKLPGIDAADARKRAQANVNELTKFQCPDGGFSFWPGECGSESPYLTAYVIHVLQRAQKLKYALDAKVPGHAYDYLDGELKAKRPENEGWWPAYTAWQAFAVDALVNAGRNEDSHINRLMAYADRMPLFGLAHLADALLAKGERTGRYEELRRRIDNGILPEGGNAHVEELNDPYLLWFWNSNVRSTAIVMRTLVRSGSDEELVKRMVRWLMRARKDGRWGNTQENAWAMEALVDYYRKYESESPEFRAVAAIGANEIAREEFRGRTTTAKSKDISMRDVLRIAPAESQVPVTFTREGTGTLFYAMRLRYARNIVLHDKLDQGFSVERHYAVQGSTTDTRSFKAGDLIKVTIRVRNTKERHYVAVTDPIPAGTEPVESWFATTASDLADAQAKADSNDNDWMSWWHYGGWVHVERHDDRVDLFATRLSGGSHEFTYMLRATTAGTFITAPLHAEEMYEPEVFGRTATDVVEVKK